jgi:predicted amidohydrolase
MLKSMSTRGANDDDVDVPVASVQTAPVFADPARNRDRSAAMIAEACGNGAKVVVLPELCISGYAFRSRGEAQDLSEPADGPSAAAWARAAAPHGAFVVGGICERDGDELFNSAILVGPDGLVGTYRKTHLWNDEKRYFAPSDLGFPVFDTPFGRIGMLICYDLWFPEAFRSCVLNGADVICVPTAWMPIPRQDPDRDSIHNILIMAAAHANSIPVICADRTGHENGVSFIGQSLVAAHTGWPAAGPAGAHQEEILFARISPQSARRARRWTAVNDLIGDRRPDQYVS